MAGMAHDHYKKDISHLKTLDVYRVCDLFGVTQPALQHAVKKVLCAGQRGAKDYERDLREAIDSISRALQMRAEDCGRPAQAAGQGIWFEFRGGKCPVDPATKVDVVRRCGFIGYGVSAGLHFWGHTGGTDDIVAYRPSKEPA